MTVITLESDNGHSPPIFGICNRRALQKLEKSLKEIRVWVILRGDFRSVG
jgi:hypothetical protein